LQKYYSKIIFRAPKDSPKDLQSELYDEIQLLKYLKNKIAGVEIPNYTYLSRDKLFAVYKKLNGQEFNPSKPHIQA